MRRWQAGLVTGRLLHKALDHYRGCPAVVAGWRAWPAPPHPSLAQDGWTALMPAAINGHDKVVERLVAAKAEVNAADQVRDEARADKTRPQPASRPAVTGVSVVADAGLSLGEALGARCLAGRRRI